MKKTLARLVARSLEGRRILTSSWREDFLGVLADLLLTAG